MARKKYSIDSRIDYSVILPVFFLFANWFGSRLYCNVK